ncbi:hypothetical protein GOODEAATRI_021186 [Goodea atripinnis]|uniref:F-box domain-containing protein n=1 Tax=Goodea atripinnis TaxID=208336 RepID=A0ABV0MJJ6_9TELE
MEVAVKGRAKRKHLNAQDCDEMGQSEDGKDALTKPHQLWGRRNPSWGLYPRTPTKQRRKGAEAGKIFSADARLVDIGTVSQCEKKEAREADYLEGITAEMFGDEEDFDEVEEEEVEPLPDAHFGLLSSGKVLSQPQGCIDDLPEEVLREVLCLIPALDLYRNVSLVCHCWRNIFLDPKFVPFKKQYFRYMMREKETVLEICSTLKNSNIIGPAASQHSIRNLVV